MRDKKSETSVTRNKSMEMCYIYIYIVLHFALHCGSRA